MPSLGAAADADGASLARWAVTHHLLCAEPGLCVLLPLTKARPPRQFRPRLTIAGLTRASLS